MKFTRAALAAMLALLSGAFLAGCHHTDWQAFAPAGGNFSVLMPGAPEDKTHGQNTANGPVTSHLYIYTANDSAWAVSYVDRPAARDGSDPEKWLDMVRDAEIAKSGGKLLEQSNIRLANNYPGREIRISLRQGDGKHAMRDRLYLVNNRLYQVLVVLPEGDLTSADAAKFLDSFTLK